MTSTQTTAALLAVLFAVVGSAPAAPPTAPVVNRAPLEPTPLLRLPIGSVRGEGWLLRQLQLQKAGLTGSAETLYDALTPDSAWLGGRGEAWEKGPYYVKGLVALAYTLDDAELKTRAQKWIDWSLSSQRPDGQFGPAGNDDWWPRMVVLWTLRDYHEATGDPRVLPFLTRYFKYELAELPKRPLVDWGRARAGDNLDIVLWTYNHTGDAALLDLARLLTTQAYPWTGIFTDNRFYGFGADYHPHHIVNVTQALKTPPVAWQFTHAPADRAAYAAGVAHLDRQYGRIDGQFSGTEQLSGNKSTDGVELCADIEHILSAYTAARVLGDANIGDRIEKVAYNSLPAHTSPRMQQITYYQLLNQPAATVGGHGFAQDYPNGNVPGPHSGFPCCCYNWHSGWPAFVSGMWAATPDGGLAAVCYGPNRVTTNVAGGVPMTVTQATDYPFAETVTLRVDPQKPAKFPLLLRVPAWCAAATVTVNGRPVDGIKAGQFLRVDRKWTGGDTVTLTFPMTIRVGTWANGSAGVERGPLAFALRVKEQWKRVRDYSGDFDEYEVRPGSPWNYALAIDRERPQARVRTGPVPAVPFDTDAPPVTLTLPAKRLPGWDYRPAAGKLTLGRSDGRWSSLADTNLAVSANVPHRLRVEAAGKALRVFVDDAPTPRLTVDTDAVAPGGVGLRAYDTRATFRDVKLDGTPVAAFDGDAWQTFGGQWTTKDGAYTVGQTRDAKAVLRTTDDLTDFVYEATVTVTPGGDAGLLLRVSDARPSLDGYRGYYVGLHATADAGHDAAEPPPSPVTSGQPTEDVELIPFGSAKLRISYFPVLKSE